MKLENKVAIVTGGAKGIGRGIVDVFLKYGAEVIILDNCESLANVLGELNQNYAEKIVGYSVDITDKEYVKKVIASIVTKFKRIDILVNNAGICNLANFLETTDEIRDRHFDINIKGSWNVAQAVVSVMMEQKHGVIVNLSSVTGDLVADPGEVAYATSKAAIIGFTKGLAAELVDYNIRVNAIQPGYVLTPLVEGMAKTTDPANPQSVLDGLAAGIPMKRLGTPHEVGELAAFLASNESSYITGAQFVIDGGAGLPETSSMGV